MLLAKNKIRNLINQQAVLNQVKYLFYHLQPLSFENFFLKIYLFQLEDNHITALWWPLPHINMALPQVHMGPQFLKPLLPPSPPHPSGLSHGTDFEYPTSCIYLVLVIYLTYGNIHVSMLFSHIISPLPSPT